MTEIQTEMEYEEALARVEKLMDALPGSPEEEELNLLCQLVEKYEEDSFSIELPDTVETMKYRVQQQEPAEADIDASEISPLGKDFFQNAEVRLPQSKVPPEIYLDADVLAWIKSQGGNELILINKILQAHIESQKNISKG